MATLFELKSINMLHTLSDRVAINEVSSLGEKQVKVSAKGLDY